jgi:hypothetical protein
MDKFYNETYLKLETAIQELEIETDCPIKELKPLYTISYKALPT